MRKLVKDLDYSNNDWNDYGTQKSYTSAGVTYADGTMLELVIDITNGPEDYIEEREWYIMIANTKDEVELIEAIKSRLQRVIDHKWSEKSIYYYLNGDCVTLSKSK